MTKELHPETLQRAAMLILDCAEYIKVLPDGAQLTAQQVVSILEHLAQELEDIAQETAEQAME